MFFCILMSYCVVFVAYEDTRKMTNRPRSGRYLYSSNICEFYTIGWENGSAQLLNNTQKFKFIFMGRSQSQRLINSQLDRLKALNVTEEQLRKKEEELYKKLIPKCMRNDLFDVYVYIGPELAEVDLYSEGVRMLFLEMVPEEPKEMPLVHMTPQAVDELSVVFLLIFVFIYVLCKILINRAIKEGNIIPAEVVYARVPGIKFKRKDKKKKDKNEIIEMASDNDNDSESGSKSESDYS